jgi:hypothetical protein
VKRRAVQILLAIGFLLSTIAAVAAVRGFGASDFFRVSWNRMPARDRRVEDSLTVITSHWACGLFWSHTRETVTMPDILMLPTGFDARHDTGPARRSPFLTSVGPRIWNGLGFMLRRDTTPATMPYGLYERSEHGVFAPTWFIALIGVAMTFFPARFLRRARRLRQRRAGGQCLACGYDLRGGAHDRCPECGATVARAVGAPAQV